MTEFTHRQRFFSYPGTMTGILGKKEENEVIRIPASDSLADIVNSLTKAQRVVVTGNIYPEEFRDQNQFYKHGSKVGLGSYKSLEDAIRDKKPFWKQREEAFRNLKKSTAYSGYGWRHLGREGFPVLTSLVDSFEAEKTLSRDQKPYSKRDIIQINDYEGSGLKEDARTEGKILIVRMHSRRRADYWHEPFLLKGVPAVDDETMYAIIRRFDSNHNCGKTTNKAVHYRSRSTGRMSGRYMDHHVIAAYLKSTLEIQKPIEDAYNRVLGILREKGVVMSMPLCPQLEMNPFALPTQEFVDFYLKLRTQVMFYSYNLQTGRRWHTPLQDAQIEKLLWDYVIAHGNKAFLPPDKVCINYDWSFPRNRAA